MVVERTVIVAAGDEVHPSALLVQKASKYESRITIQMDNKTVNAKSIMGIISLGLLDGSKITISADGSDENSAIEELAKFLENAI